MILLLGICNHCARLSEGKLQTNPIALLLLCPLCDLILHSLERRKCCFAQKDNGKDVDDATATLWPWLLGSASTVVEAEAACDSPTIRHNIKEKGESEKLENEAPRTRKKSRSCLRL